jgi:hypothetical protein
VTPPLGIFGLDVGELVEDAVRALVDLVVPDFGSQWVSSLVTWLVALPPVTGDAFPSLNRYADQLAAVGFGLLGACFLAGLLQLWAGAAAGAEAVRRAAIGAGALALYTTVLQSLLVGVNVLTAEMIRHPLVVDGLDKAFGTSLTVAAVTGGVSLGLAIGAALVVLYFIAALFVLKIGLTAILAVAVVGGALVWGLYPLPQTQWLARAWLSGVVAALVVPIAWACIFAAAALLGRDTLVFDGGGEFNAPLGEALGYLVKPFAAVACFWIAYRAPYFLLGIARTAGLSAAVLRRGGSSTGGSSSGRQHGPQTAEGRFRAFFISPARRSTSAAAVHTSRLDAGRGARPAARERTRRARATRRHHEGTPATTAATGTKHVARPATRPDGQPPRGSDTATKRKAESARPPKPTERPTATPTRPPVAAPAPGSRPASDDTTPRRDGAPSQGRAPARPTPKTPAGAQKRSNRTPTTSRPVRSTSTRTTTPARQPSRSTRTAGTTRPGRSTSTRPSAPSRPPTRERETRGAPARPKPSPATRAAKPPDHREPPRRPA